jgi:hypothetical protein
MGPAVAGGAFYFCGMRRLALTQRGRPNGCARISWRRLELRYPGASDVFEMLR